MSLDLSLLGAEGVMLSDLLGPIQAVSKEGFLEACQGPFILQIPVDKPTQPSSSERKTMRLEEEPVGPDVTAVVSLKQLRSMKRSKRVHTTHLHYLTPPEKGGPIVIGRGASCEVILPEGSVSKRHARLTREGDGWLLKDLDSQNGTYVNGKRLSPGEAVAVENKQNLWFSSYQCIFLVPEQIYGLVEMIRQQR